MKYRKKKKTFKFVISTTHISTYKTNRYLFNNLFFLNTKLVKIVSFVSLYKPHQRNKTWEEDYSL